MLVAKMKKHNINAKCDRLFRRHTIRKVFRAVEAVTRAKKAIKKKIK